MDTPTSSPDRIARAFGRLLRAERERCRMTQDQLAEASGLSTLYIYFLEKGRRQPTITTLFRLAAALKTSPAELMRALSEGRIPED